MSNIRDDFKGYFDGNGLLAPGPVSPGTLSASDNGTLFLAEYMIMLKKSGQLTQADIDYFEGHIDCCISSNMLNRVPAGQDDGQEEFDDYLGVLNGCRELGLTSIPRTLLWGMIRYLGFMNNSDPGKFTENSFLARQPQPSRLWLMRPFLLCGIHYII